MSKIITDANTVVAQISHKLTEFSAIYPITPSSTMGEEYSKLSERGEKNIFGNIPQVEVMQSETGAIASCFGSLYGGLYSTTFSSSQGLLLMIPNLYKLASSLKPFVLNVASRSLSTHALNIFCDHSDVYSTLSSGNSVLCSSNVQKAQDFCMISHMLTLKSKIPVLHCFDGFITSHKTDTIEELDDNLIKDLFPQKEFDEFKHDMLISSNPRTFGTNQNPDIYFQNRERINEYEEKVPQILNECFEKFFEKTGRKYQIFEYFGDKNAIKVVVLMGSAYETAKNAVKVLGKDYGVLCVNLLNPFCKEEFLKVLPKQTKIITVLDRTKQTGNICEELAKNVYAMFDEKSCIKILHGRYGIGGKDFDINMAISVFENMDKEQKNNFVVGIDDDISNNSLVINEKNIIDSKIFENKIDKIAFFGVGNDGTVSASKLFMKLASKNDFVCGNSYYDSKKSGNLTESQIFVSKSKFEINYKDKGFDFVVISNIELLNKYNLSDAFKENSVVLINCDGDENKLSNLNKYLLLKNSSKVYFIDANKIAEKNNLGSKINLIMLASFVEISNIVSKDAFINNLKIESAKKFGKSVDYLNDLCNSVFKFNISLNKTDYENIKIENKKELPVSSFKANGEVENMNTFTVFYNKKAFWLENKCIKCTNCAQICPHSAISVKLVNAKELQNAPQDFKYIKNNDDTCFCLFVDTSKCTGCENCVKICPTKALIIKNYANLNKEFFDKLTPIYNNKNQKNLAYNQSYYSCNSSCTGCIETIYFKLLGTMFGSHLNLINATGCSSIYNAGINCSPFSKDSQNFGTNFVSNLFEDNAEFGFGVSNAALKSREIFFERLKANFESLSPKFKDILKNFIENKNDFAICQNAFEMVKTLKEENLFDKFLIENAQLLIPMINFIVGGDGWAYDIDFGGIDHIVSQNKNVNILILDNEVYSNTGGQTSKATNLGAKTKYTNEKQTQKKDLFLSLFQYQNLHFAKVNFAENKNQCIKAFNDAANHNGPSVIVAYTPCINHKIDMKNSFNHASLATKSGYFNLITYLNGNLTLDSTPNFNLLEDFMLSEGRYEKISKDTLEKLIKSKTCEFEFYKKLCEILNNK